MIYHYNKNKSGVYIGRPKSGGEWGFGNPFVIGKDGSRAEVIEKFKSWLDTPSKNPHPDATWQRLDMEKVILGVEEVFKVKRGKFTGLENLDKSTNKIYADLQHCSTLHNFLSEEPDKDGYLIIRFKNHD